AGVPEGGGDADASATVRAASDTGLAATRVAAATDQNAAATVTATAASFDPASADPVADASLDVLPTQQNTASPAASANAGKSLPAAYQTAQVNLPHLAFEIARQVQQGTTQFQVRLDPPELGRIDVRLDIDNGGNVNARLTVERSETLDLLQRDQRALERALAQAGLDGSKTNLEFSLKQNPFERPQGGPFEHGGESGSSPLLAD